MKTKKKPVRKKKVVSFYITNRAEWYQDSKINKSEPYACFDDKGMCKFFSNAVIIGKFREEKKGPWLPLDIINKGLFLPCRHVCSINRCQSLDIHGVCPIRIKERK